MENKLNKFLGRKPTEVIPAPKSTPEAEPKP